MTWLCFGSVIRYGHTLLPYADTLGPRPARCRAEFRRCHRRRKFFSVQCRTISHVWLKTLEIYKLRCVRGENHIRLQRLAGKKNFFSFAFLTRLLEKTGLNSGLQLHFFWTVPLSQRPFPSELLGAQPRGQQQL